MQYFFYKFLTYRSLLRLGVFFLGMTILLWGCKKPVEPRWRTVPVSNLYSIDLPSKLVSRNDMHESAGLQYYDLASDFYIIGMEEAKDNVKAVKSDIKMDDYYKMVEDTITSGAIYKRFIQGQKAKGDGFNLKAGDYQIVKDLRGKEYHLLYRIAVIESKKYFIQLVMYMPYSDSCNVFPKMDTITNSFKILQENLNKT